MRLCGGARWLLKGRPYDFRVCRYHQTASSTATTARISGCGIALLRGELVFQERFKGDAGGLKFAPDALREVLLFGEVASGLGQIVHQLFDPLQAFKRDYGIEDAVHAQDCSGFVTGQTSRLQPDLRLRSFSTLPREFVGGFVSGESIQLGLDLPNPAQESREFLLDVLHLVRQDGRGFCAGRPGRSALAGLAAWPSAASERGFLLRGFATTGGGDPLSTPEGCIRSAT